MSDERTYQLPMSVVVAMQTERTELMNTFINSPGVSDHEREIARLLADLIEDRRKLRGENEKLHNMVLTMKGQIASICAMVEGFGNLIEGNG